jgi:integrase
VKHQPALPYGELSTFLADLRARDGVGPRALEFMILVARRTSEITRAEWQQFDLDAKLWIASVARPKPGIEHRVSLSETALAILRDMEGHRREKFVFAGPYTGQPLSEMTLSMLLRRMNADREKAGQPRYTDGRQWRDVVPGGFRVTFKEWARERTSFADDVVDAALGGAMYYDAEPGSSPDLFAKCRNLMDAWGEYACLPAHGGVISLKRTG